MINTREAISILLFTGLMTIQTADATTKDTWFVGAGAGQSWLYSLRGSTTVSNGSNATPPYDQDYFSIKQPSSQTQAQLDIGYQWHENKKFIPSYSTFLRYRHYFSTQFSGIVDQYSIPEFENYTYKMRYNADLLTLNGKINLVECKSILPYLSAGIGAVFNHMKDYTETASANVTSRISPNYSSNTAIAPAVALGIGIDIHFTPAVWATLGAEYLFQGNISSGNGSITWSGTHLVFANNAKMSTVFLSISATIPDGFRS